MAFGPVGDPVTAPCPWLKVYPNVSHQTAVKSRDQDLVSVSESTPQMNAIHTDRVPVSGMHVVV